MNVLISGGCKNGKSYHAQRMAKEQSVKLNKPLYYVATMIPRDQEDHARIRRHVAERDGWGFVTIQQGRDLTQILMDPQVDRSGVFLLDSLTALLDNEMFDEQGRLDVGAGVRVREDVVAFAEATGNTIFVSDFLYSDADQYSETVESYRHSLAAIDKALAACCQQVIEVIYGMKERWK